jgi:hypothetical protein
VNGRLEEGYRNRPVSSMVDYLITGCDSYNTINELKILDLNDFSDLCPIKFSINCYVEGTEINLLYVIKLYGIFQKPTILI